MAVQDKFNKANTIYKITQDLDLSSEYVTMPAGCTLDFQGGKLTGGTIELTNTLVLPLGCNILDFISSTVAGTYKEGQLLYDSSLKKMKLWNGSAWVNLDGTTLVSSMSEVPASQDITY